MRIHELKIDDKLVQIQERVMNCYRNNLDRTLDCWREVEEFKKVSIQVMDEYLQTH